MDSSALGTVDEYWKWVFSLPILQLAGDGTTEVSTWKQADALADSDEYVNTIVAASNDLSARVREVDEIEFQIGWNARGYSLEPMKQRFKLEVLTPRISIHGHFPELTTCIANQVTMGAMEILYRPVVHFDWYRRLVNVLSTGHVVCGYRGEYPNGNIIVF
jgi:hypothetical protein